MIDNPFSLTVEVLRDGALLGSVVASVTPCVEDAHFRAVVAGELPNDGNFPPITVSPIWHESGAPRVAGVSFSRAGEPAGTYTNRIFVPWAKAIVAELLREKRLENSDGVEWRVVANERPRTAAPRFRARATRAPYPLRAGSVPGGARGTLAVVIDADLLDGIREAVVASPGIECAGLLTGQLIHDPERGAAALAVTDHIRATAGEGGASDVHFTFTADSFLAARRTLASAPDGSVTAGWWHSHPPCARCGENPECRADTIFFSLADLQVHATAFPAAYMVALVAGKLARDSARRPGFRLYGWEHGVVGERPMAPVGEEVEPRLTADAAVIS